jgi:hypothetical protein
MPLNLSSSISSDTSATAFILSIVNLSCTLRVRKITFRHSGTLIAIREKIKMSEMEIAMFAMQFGTALFFAVAWLIICKTIRNLRRKLGFSYGGASLIALLTCLISVEGPTLSALIASFLVIVILYWQWKRALKKQSFEANTIISYENHPI